MGLCDTSSLIPGDVLAAMVKTAQGTPPGTWVEVGVFKGGSALPLYAARGTRALHLFDTFEGIPFGEPLKGDRHIPGEFNGAEALPTLRHLMPDAHFHVGCFPATLPDDLTDVAFAHIDCDQFRSISDCITHLWPRMVDQGIMWFDDYNFIDGAREAVLAHFSEDQLQHAPGGRRFVLKT